MQYENNGWFQMESHAPVKGPKPSGSGNAPGRPASGPGQQRQKNAPSDNSGGSTYGQRSTPANVQPSGTNPQTDPPAQRAPGRPASRPGQQRQKNAPNDNSGGSTYGQRSTPEKMQPYGANLQTDPSAQERTWFSAGRMQDNFDTENAAPFRQYTAPAPEMAPLHGMMAETRPEPAAVPENMPMNPDRPKDTLAWDWDRVLNTRHSQTIGPRGQVLEQDSTLHEALEVFVHTKLLERPVHVKGFGALGDFRTTNSMREYTKLSFLQTPGQQVPVLVRFSLAAGNKGTPDTSRGARGFAAKFYARDGIFDLLCNHIPVLFVRDGMRFPEAFTSLTPSPASNLTDPERFWRFVADAPEATHFVTWLYSNVGTVKSFRHIRGFGVNTYVWRNAEGVCRYVKYHWIPLAGEEYIDRQEAAALAGVNPDIAGQDLYDTIAAGTPVQYELRVQMMDPQDERMLPYDPLDCTKIWDEQAYPLMPVGRLTLNRNPVDYMEQIEKVAFSPANLLDGAEFSADKLLQARANIYWDSQRHRLGDNFRSIPVNDQKDWTPDVQVTSGAGEQVGGDLVRSSIPDPDDFTQAGQRYLSLSPAERTQLVDNLAADLAAVSQGIQSVVLRYLGAANAEFGQRVASQIAVYARR